MKINTLLIAGFSLLSLAACIKHEIIPAPEPRVELICHFNGKIGGSDLELTQNVQGYYLETNKLKIVPPTGFSEAVYYSEIKSADNSVAVKLSMGKMKWDGGTSNDPSVTVFNNFFKNNLIPSYTTGAVLTTAGTAGLEVSYRDGVGNIWLSKEADNNVNTIEFTNLSQETDKTGDYSKFIANFNCKVYHTFVTIVQHPAPQPNDTILDEQSFLISDGVFKGWYKR